jgi:leucine dehydrogenase
MPHGRGAPPQIAGTLPDPGRAILTKTLSGPALRLQRHRTPTAQKMVFDCPDFADHEQVVFAHDARSGLRAILAIHSTVLGPAIGGCRIWPYPSEQSAVRDVLRLSRGMTYKAGIAGVPFGGGKVVVIGDPHRQKSPMLLQAIGRAIEALGGRYITGEDVGTTAADMAEIRKTTDNVMGMPEEQGGSGDPSPSTALGCLVGIEACVRYALQRSDLAGVHIAVQGLGNVGLNLCRQLAKAGAKLTVADVRPGPVDEAVKMLGATSVGADGIYDVEADVFAPCALGAVIDDAAVDRLKARIVAGGANNQLAAPRHGHLLKRRGILYAPDYVINGGGMIQLAIERQGLDRTEINRRVRAIHETLMAVFQKAEAENLSTSEAADRIVEERLQAHIRAAAA